jgi:phage terminase large subunit-like protein
VVWSDKGYTPRSTTLEKNRLTITPLRRLSFVSAFHSEQRIQYAK